MSRPHLCRCNWPAGCLRPRFSVALSSAACQSMITIQSWLLDPSCLPQYFRISKRVQTLTLLCRCWSFVASRKTLPTLSRTPGSNHRGRQSAVSERRLL